jgi:tRNA nucleotidyltransferase (CCA-adding enzyme)
MLRAVRFSAQLGFAIDAAALTAIRENRALLKNVSVERIWSEFTKTLCAPRAEKLFLLRETGVFACLFPEIDVMFETPQNTKYHAYDVGTHSLTAAVFTRPGLTLRLAALLHDIGKPLARTTEADGTDHFYGHPKISAEIADRLLTRFKCDNRAREDVLRLIQYHDMEILPEKRAVKRAMQKAGPERFETLLQLKEADCMAQNLSVTAPRLTRCAEIRRLYREILTAKEPLSLADLAVKGGDLLALGYKGKEIGDVKGKLLEYVVENPEQNQKEILLRLVKNGM